MPVCASQKYVKWDAAQIAAKRMWFEAESDTLLLAEVTDLVQVYFLLRQDPDAQVSLWASSDG